MILITFVTTDTNNNNAYRENSSHPDHHSPTRSRTMGGCDEPSRGLQPDVRVRF